MHQEQCDVRSFHFAMDQAVEPTPTVPAEKIVRLRGALVAEEFFEFVDSMFAFHDSASLKQAVMNGVQHAPIVVDIVDMADAIADLKYVLEGTNLAFGIDGQGVWEEVHAANMRKASGPVSPEGKRLKPPGWKPPNILQVLVNQGYMPPAVAGEIPALQLEEGERQALLLALGHLSAARPGWDDMLNRIAVRIDNVKDGRAVMFDEFRATAQTRATPATESEEVTGL